MTKREMAELMTEHFVDGCSAKRYWMNRYMRIHKAGLFKLLEIRTDPNRTPADGATWLSIVQGVES